MTENDRFDDAPISRRRFFQLSAATGAALALPGNATATTTSGKFTEEYEYVLNHTPADHAVPTLVQFDDADGPAAMEAAVSTPSSSTERDCCPSTRHRPSGTCGRTVDGYSKSTGAENWPETFGRVCQNLLYRPVIVC